MNTAPTIPICFIEISGSEEDNTAIEGLANSLPGHLQLKIGRKKFRKDRVVRAAGWLLLKYQLIQAGYDVELLAEVQNTDFGKPFIAGTFNFSISYSGNFAICAAANVIHLGVDIEIVRDIELFDFSRYFNDTEWSKIVCSEDPKKSFFQYWTRKESVLKADGRGMSVDLRDVSINETTGHISDSSIQYCLFSLPEIGDKIAAYLCTDQPNTLLAVKKIEIDHLSSAVRGG